MEGRTMEERRINVTHANKECGMKQLIVELLTQAIERNVLSYILNGWFCGVPYVHRLLIF